MLILLGILSEQIELLIELQIEILFDRPSAITVSVRVINRVIIIWSLRGHEV